MIRLRDPGGAAFAGALAAASAAVWWACADLRFGTPMRMGPGFFPVVLSWIGLGIAAALLARAVVFAGPPIERWGWRGLAFVLAGVAVFLSVREIGLAASVVLATLIASAGGRDARPREAVMLAAFLAAFAAGVFVFGLGLPIPLWPWS